MNDYGVCLIKKDNTIVSYGRDDSTYLLRYNTNVSSQTNIKRVVYNYYAFAALKTDGTVFTWGNSSSGGDSSSVSNQLINVIDIVASKNSFIAIRSDNKVVGWGNTNQLKDLPSEIENIKEVTINNQNYIFLKEDGTVVAVGKDYTSSDEISFSSVSNNLSNVKRVYCCLDAFAAVKNDGSVVTWGKKHRVEIVVVLVII